ncbi:peroxiredoxin (alkyl hydroperoxide reductase subunit C) [Orenia marismortui]|uniref:Peroxiredoxin n=1 Tax=Orenia marismortui TaxID=46469 RepID=A0A4R8GZZ6_9FIRM|nr:peroxiredoxin [Orenia marismortui]TDX51031.1 peroxiredoxin (alkyl hydroperoxide reductase subunit C) [Orenia marismortui]
MSSILKGSRTFSKDSVQETGNIPRINDPAPDFTAITTQGEISLSDYRGRWVMLFSHPSDFTPVCTTEFVSFAQNYERFRERNVSLIGLSIDSVYSHIAWVRNIEELFGVKIPFPIIDDLGFKVANKYGMIQPGVSDTSAVRAVFIIDPEQIIRAIVYYPPQVGRNTNELLRLIEALQTADKYNVATPANWHPGEAVIVPPPKTVKEAEDRLKQGYNCKDWYFCYRDLPERRR